MAGVNYEVNIQLNTKAVDKQLNELEKRVNSLKKSLSTPGRTEEQTTKATAKAAEKLANLRQMSTRAQILNRNLGDKIAQLEAKGLDLSKARYQLDKAAEAQGKNQLIIAQTRNKLARDFYNDALKTLKVQERQTAEQDKQTRKAAAGAKKARNQRLQGVALGAGFPLLFGGGPGAILGGAAGGLVGGPAGFAAQIALSALGQQLDMFVGSTLEASKAFTSTAKAFDFVSEKSLFSSQQIEARAIELEKQGKAEELATLLTEELAKVVGTDGVKSLQLLGDETNEVTRLWNQLTLQLQALIAGPLTDFLKLVSQFVGGITLRSRFSALEKSVTPDQARRLNEILTEKRGTRTISAAEKRAGFSDPRFQTESALKDIGKQIVIPGTITNKVLRETLAQAEKEGIKAPAVPGIPVTPLDRLSITPPKTKKPAKGRRSRLGDFQADLAQAQELFTLEKSIYQARFNDDRKALIRFEKVRELLSIREKEQTILASDRSEAEKRAQLDTLALERKRASLEESYKLADLERTMGRERGEAMLAAIEQQNQLNLGLQQQIQLSDSLSQVLGQGLTSSFDLLINSTENWGNALRDIAATVLRDIARQLIQIYVIEQAVGFLRQAFGPGPQFGKYYSVNGVGTAGPNYGIPQRARGGPVSAGQPYMVGERGPELFVPGAQGNIVPNSSMGGANITVNVDASGSNVQGNQPDAAQLGRAIGAAVQAELIKQKRPGGLLA